MTMGQRAWILCMTSVAVMVALGTPAQGQDEKKKLAMTSWSDVDVDFHFLGEYQGCVTDGCGRRVSAGIQITPTGSGEFIGVRYACGLPGTGWNRSDREELVGKREGDVVRLVGEQSRVDVRRGGATLCGAEGAFSGYLPKVHRRSPTLGQPAPYGALALFDGTNVDQFKGGRINDQGWLEEGTELVQKFRDYTLHLEFRLPYMPNAKGQGRANSGVYLQSSYEVQVLDSFALEGKENECGALYRYRRPDLNMCLPPLSWQTYDLTFHAPKYDAEGKKYQNARITVLHNGVDVHDDFEVERKTGAGKQETLELWPTKIQNHGNPVRFRNIWLIDLAKSPPTSRRGVLTLGPGITPLLHVANVNR